MVKRGWGDFQEQEYQTSVYSQNHVHINKQTSTFEKEVRELPFPDEIKNIMIEVNRKITCEYQKDSKKKVRRKGKKDQIKFICAFEAFNRTGDYKDPKWIAEMCGLPHSKITSALATCREVDTGVRLTNHYPGPLDFLPQYYIALGLEPCNYKFFEKNAKEILGSEFAHELADKKPQNVAAALLQYFSINSGVSVDGKASLEKISNMVGISDITINNLVDIISVIDNGKKE